MYTFKIVITADMHNYPRVLKRDSPLSSEGPPHYDKTTRAKIWPWAPIWGLIPRQTNYLPVVTWFCVWHQNRLFDLLLVKPNTTVLSPSIYYFSKNVLLPSGNTRFPFCCIEFEIFLTLFNCIFFPPLNLFLSLYNAVWPVEGIEEWCLFSMPNTQVFGQHAK